MSTRGTDDLNLALLTNVFDNTLQTPIKHADFLDSCFAVCQQVAMSLKIKLKKPSVEGCSELDPVNYITKVAETNHCRIRKITLLEEWWKMDLGSLIVFYQNQICSLLPLKKGGYQLVNQRDGTSHHVTEKIAVDIDTAAYIIYPSFSNQKLTLLDIWKFTTTTLGRDFYKFITLQIFASLLILFIPVATGIIFDNAIPDANRYLLMDFAIILVVNIVVISLTKLAQMVTLLRVQIKAEHRLQAGIWDRLLRLPLTFFKKFTAGDLTYRAGCVAEIQEMISMDVVITVISGVVSIINLVLMFYLDVYLSLGVLALTFVFIFATVSFSILILKQDLQIISQSSKITGLILELVNLIVKLRVANREKAGFQLWVKEYASQTEAQLRAGKLHMGLVVFNAGFVGLTLLVIYSLVVMRGSALNFEAFIIFNAALMQFFTSITAMTAVISDSLAIKSLYNRARPIFETLPEETENQSEPGIIDGHIVIKNVVFRYDSNSKPLLKNYSLEIPPGSFTAIVGPSGSGKSTIFRLLLGLEQPESGEIFYSGMNIKALRIQSLRQQLGVVMQSTQLIPGTLYENIVGQRYGLPREAAWDIAELIGIADMIHKLPMGMDTPINDGIQTLSGGEIQQINLARAIAARPKILLLDEATSAMDNKIQYKVQSYLHQLNITQIIIAQRLSSIVNADRIYVIDKGTLIEAGNYDELMSQKGLFYQFAQRQI